MSMIQVADVGIGISGQEGMQVNDQGCESFSMSRLIPNSFLIHNDF